MSETFYSVLGVESDADQETIKQAYRELVKDHHPDVSDEDDAAETFKRITDARDVLLEEERRDRYDRIGHYKFVKNHLDSNAWSVSDVGAGGSPGSSSGSSTGGSRSGRSPGSQGGRRRSRKRSRGASDSARNRQSSRSTSPGGDSTTEDPFEGDEDTEWADEAADEYEYASSTSTTDGSDGRDRDPRQRARADGWQTSKTASNPYGTARTTTATHGIENFQQLLGEIGPWIAFHFVFLISAFVTIWLIMSWTTSLVTVLLSLVLLAATVFFSILHMISRVYS